MAETRARLRKPLERSLRAGHPWIFRDALDRLDAHPGDVVTVFDAKGRFVARGLADGGPIGVRVLTVDDVPVDMALFEARLRAAIALRRTLFDPGATDAYRVVHGEGDRLPGLVVDRYAEHAVVRLDGSHLDAWLERLVPALRVALEPIGVRSLHARSGRGDRRELRTLAGEPPPERLRVREHGMTLLADLAHGQKTGLFLDQRESRRRVRELARDRHVLNLYGYTGGFSVAAGLGGARDVTTVDVAAPALALAESTWAANGLDPASHCSVAADALPWIAAAPPRSFGLVIADPPSFAPREQAVPQALVAYASLHAACLALVEDGGLYLAASCSSHVRMDAFEKTLAEGARPSKTVLQRIDRWGAPGDHPSLLAFPEGDYLKCVLLRVLGRRART